MLGWKEYELELMRDRKDNVVVVCSIENLDPMGVHTGDSITVAPAMTLTDREYQRLRDIAIDVIRAVGVDTGGCNIQFAVNPRDGRVIVIEMNPRVSRSSALASKATGFPIAKIAAKLAIGYTLDEIPNDITRETPASFEPTLDYVVVKVPRFAFEKFPGADPTLTTHMKSVGEAMAIGRSFTEALQKALRSLEKQGRAVRLAAGETDAAIDRRGAGAGRAGRRCRTTGGCGVVQQALRAGRERRAAARRDRHRPVVPRPDRAAQRARRRDRGGAPSSTATCCARAKRHGFSDAQLGQLRGMPEDVVRGVRHALGIRPVFKTVDTCAAEFAATTPYHYSSYDEETEVAPREEPAVIILGSGPNRIGQGIEFDYSCVHASFALRDAGTADRDGQLQPGDRVHRLRHLRPALLRAAHPRGRPRGRARRAAGRPGGRRHRAARRPDPARAGAGAQGRRRADRRHLARRPSTWPRTAASFGPGARRRRAARAQARHRDVVRRRAAGRRRDRLPGAGAAVLRARRPRHGDRLRRGAARHLHGRGDRGLRRPPGARRPVPRRRDRDRRRRPLRRRRALPRRRDGAHRGGRHPLRRLRLRAAAGDPGSRGDRAGPRVHRGAGRGVWACAGLLNVQFALAADVLYVLEANPRASRTVPFVSKATGVPLAKAAARVMLGRDHRRAARRGAAARDR